MTSLGELFRRKKEPSIKPAVAASEADTTEELYQPQTPTESAILAIAQKVDTQSPTEETESFQELIFALVEHQIRESIEHNSWFSTTKEAQPLVSYTSWESSVNNPIKIGLLLEDKPRSIGELRNVWVDLSESALGLAMTQSHSQELVFPFAKDDAQKATERITQAMVEFVSAEVKQALAATKELTSQLVAETNPLREQNLKHMARTIDIKVSEAMTNTRNKIAQLMEVLLQDNYRQLTQQSDYIAGNWNTVPIPVDHGRSAYQDLLRDMVAIPFIFPKETIMEMMAEQKTKAALLRKEAADSETS